MRKLDDSKIEILIDNLNRKSEIIIKYYREMFNKSFEESAKFRPFLKEMSLLIIFTLNEVNIMKNVLKKRSIMEDMEIYIIKFSKKEYDHSHCNLLKENVFLNFENPMIEKYLITFDENSQLLEELLTLILKDLQIDLHQIKGSKKLLELTGSDFGYLEKYFFKILEHGFSNFKKKEFQEASKEFTLAKYLYETIIMLNVLERNRTKNFFDIFDLIVEKSLKEEDENHTILSLLGGPIREMKKNNVILPSDSSERVLKSNSYNDEDKERDFISILLFYPEIIKLIFDCEKKM